MLATRTAVAPPPSQRGILVQPLILELPRHTPKGGIWVKPLEPLPSSNFKEQIQKSTPEPPSKLPPSPAPMSKALQYMQDMRNASLSEEVEAGQDARPKSDGSDRSASVSDSASTSGPLPDCVSDTQLRQAGTALETHQDQLEMLMRMNQPQAPQQTPQQQQQHLLHHHHHNEQQGPSTPPVAAAAAEAATAPPKPAPTTAAAVLPAALTQPGHSGADAAGRAKTDSSTDGSTASSTSSRQMPMKGILVQPLILEHPSHPPKEGIWVEHLEPFPRSNSKEQVRKTTSEPPTQLPPSPAPMSNALRYMQYKRNANLSGSEEVEAAQLARPKSDATGSNASVSDSASTLAPLSDFVSVSGTQLEHPGTALELQQEQLEMLVKMTPPQAPHQEPQQQQQQHQQHLLRHDQHEQQGSPAPPAADAATATRPPEPAPAAPAAATAVLPAALTQPGHSGAVAAGREKTDSSTGGSIASSASSRRMNRINSEAERKKQQAASSRSAKSKSSHLTREQEVACCVILQEYHAAQGAGASSSPEATHQRVSLEAAAGAASSALLKAHGRYINGLCSRFLRKGRNVQREDLLFAGQMGLLEAAHRFKPDATVQLLSFAHFHILNSIMAAVRGACPQVLYIPRQMYDIRTKVIRAVQELTDEHYTALAIAGGDVNASSAAIKRQYKAAAELEQYTPSIPVIAARANVSVRAINDFQHWCRLSIGGIVDAEGDDGKDGVGGKAVVGKNVDISTMEAEESEEMRGQSAAMEMSIKEVFHLLSSVVATKDVADAVVSALGLDRGGQPRNASQTAEHLGIHRQTADHRVRRGMDSLAKACEKDHSLAAKLREAMQPFS